jgi:hypothetical protein
VRPTAQQLLDHPWFSHAGEDGQNAVLPEGNMSHVVARLEAFAGMSRMKRLALSLLCHTVTDRHITRLKVGVSLLLVTERAFDGVCHTDELGMLMQCLQVDWSHMQLH